MSRKSEFIIIYNEWMSLIDKGFTYGEINLLALINSFDDCWMTDKRKAEILHVSERGLRKWKKHLKDAGLIEESNRGYSINCSVLNKLTLGTTVPTK